MLPTLRRTSRFRSIAAVFLAGALFACSGAPTGEVPVPETPGAPKAPEAPPPTGTQDATSLTMGTGAAAVTTDGEFLSIPIVVRALAGPTTPVAGVTVTFSMKRGSGTISVTQAVTDAKGEATTILRYPYDELNVVAAQVGEHARSETSVGSWRTHDGWIRSVKGPFLDGVAGQPLAEPLAVRVLARDGKTPLVGRTIGFTLELGGGSLGATTAVTDADGIARVSWTLGPAYGVNRVLVTGDKLIPMTIHAFSAPR